jgi:hypothetical protein
VSLAHPTRYQFRHYGAGGLLWASGLSDDDIAAARHAPAEEVAAAQLWTPNQLADEGEQMMLDCSFRGAVNTGNLFFALVGQAPSETTTMATLAGELTVANGYARIAVARNTTDWPTLALQGGDFRADSATKTFTATGTWAAATHLCLVSSASGTSGLFIAWSALSATRTLVNGDTLQVSMRISQS